MTLLLSVLNQAKYPGAGAIIDDCWAVATIWAYRAATGATILPTITAFRAAAGKPDVPGKVVGGNIADIMRAVGVLWPDEPVTEWAHPDWDGFAALVRAGGIASLAVSSALLPTALRYGFLGAHQVGVVYEGGQWLVANPLAPQGSAPQAITEPLLSLAARAVDNGWVLAAVFPRGVEMDISSSVLQRWTANGTDGALRLHPKRSDPVIDHVPAGQEIISYGEWQDTATGHDWRFGPWPRDGRRTVYWLRKGPGVAPDHDFIAGPFATIAPATDPAPAARAAGFAAALKDATAITKKAAADVAAIKDAG